MPGLKRLCNVIGLALVWRRAIRRGQRLTTSPEWKRARSIPMGDKGRLRIVTVVGVAGVVAGAAFPPWHWTFRQMSGSCGYSFIAISPEDTRGCSIDAMRLLLEWVGIGGLVAIAFMLRRGRGTAPPGADAGTGPKPTPPPTPSAAPPVGDDFVAAVEAVGRLTPETYFPTRPAAPMIPPAPPTAARPPGVQPRIFSGKPGALSAMDRARAWNAALISVEQERRAREGRISAHCHRRLSEAYAADSATAHPTAFPTPFSPIDQICWTLRRLEALPARDQVDEAGMTMLRDWIGRRE